MGELKYKTGGEFIPFEGAPDSPPPSIPDYIACSGNGSYAGQDTGATDRNLPYDDAELADADYVFVFVTGFTGSATPTVRMGGQTAAVHQLYTTPRYTGQNSSTRTVLAVFNNTSGQLGTSGDVTVVMSQASQQIYAAMIWVGIRAGYSGLTDNGMLQQPATGSNQYLVPPIGDDVTLAFVGGYSSSTSISYVEGDASLIVEGDGGNGWAGALLVGPEPSRVIMSTTGATYAYCNRLIPALP